ncbi:hypothetical protein D3C85_1348350 [compost metagenome]
MVAVLLASAGITAGSLQVASRVGTDPYIGVGRRDHQGLDPLEGGRVGDPVALCIEVDEPAAQRLAAQAGLGVIDILQGGGQGGVGHGAGPVTGLVLWTATSTQQCHRLDLCP